MQKEMDRLLMERSLIERELDCSQHDPIEVVLIFDKSNAAAPSSDTTRLQKKKRKRTRPRPSSAYSPAAGGGGQGKRPKRHKGKKQKKKQKVNSAEVYYDPTKLKFVFSTPSPLSPLKQQQSLPAQGSYPASPRVERRLTTPSNAYPNTLTVQIGGEAAATLFNFKLPKN